MDRKQYQNDSGLHVKVSDMPEQKREVAVYFAGKHPELEK